MGRQFKLAEDFDLKASSMLKIVKGAPISADITALAGFRERFWVGGMFRFDSAMGIISQFQINEKMLIGYSYELPLNRVNNFSNGTHEIMFGYNLSLFK